MKGLIALLLAALCVAGLNAECPDYNMLGDENHVRLCAQMFEHSSDNYDKSCTGDFIYIYPFEDTPIMPWFWENRVSSLVVGYGCTLTVWSGSMKTGYKMRFSGGPVYHLEEIQLGQYGNWDDSISGYNCTC